MPKKKIPRIQLDKPNAQIAILHEKLQAVEVEIKKANPEFKLPEIEARK